MNRVSSNRRKSKRPGSFERRGGQQTRALNPKKGARIARNRALWKENAPASVREMLCKAGREAEPGSVRRAT